jgi:hypothetical protein
VLDTSLALLDCIDDEIVEGRTGSSDRDVVLVVDDTEISKSPLTVS